MHFGIVRLACTWSLIDALMFAAHAAHAEGNSKVAG
jgi:hypothetical protein